MQHARHSGRTLAHDCSIWNDDVTPKHSADPAEKADLIAEVLESDLADFDHRPLPPPGEDGVTVI